MLEVAFPGMPGTGGKRALAVADLDQVTQGVAGPVGVRLAAVVAAECGNRLEFHGEDPAVGQAELPGAVTDGRSVIVGRSVIATADE